MRKDEVVEFAGPWPTRVIEIFIEQKQVIVSYKKKFKKNLPSEIQSSETPQFLSFDCLL